MCGRFTLTGTFEDVQEHFQLTQGFYMSPRYNIAPSLKILVQIKPGNVEFFDWGLKVSWLTETLQPKLFINARAETISEKPLFRQAFKKRRCLIIADGFYEWKTLGRYKQPYYIHKKDHSVFAMAGIYENETAAIITTCANSLIAEVHSRMPVILTKKDYNHWLNPSFDDVKISSLLQTSLSEDWSLYPVSNAVNRPDFDNKLCIHPLQTDQI